MSVRSVRSGMGMMDGRFPSHKRSDQRNNVVNMHVYKNNERAPDIGNLVSHRSMMISKSV